MGLVSLRAVMGMQTRSEPSPALVDRQRERQALDSLVQDLRSTSAGAGSDRVCMPITARRETRPIHRGNQVSRRVVLPHAAA